jgi:hypothetical protein
MRELKRAERRMTATWPLFRPDLERTLTAAADQDYGTGKKSNCAGSGCRVDLRRFVVVSVPVVIIGECTGYEGRAYKSEQY